jgi:hypothetical protein
MINIDPAPPENTRFESTEISTDYYKAPKANTGAFNTIEDIFSDPVLMEQILNFLPDAEAFKELSNKSDMVQFGTPLKTFSKHCSGLIELVNKSPWRRIFNIQLRTNHILETGISLPPLDSVS